VHDSNGLPVGAENYFTRGSSLKATTSRNGFPWAVGSPTCIFTIDGIVLVSKTAHETHFWQILKSFNSRECIMKIL